MFDTGCSQNIKTTKPDADSRIGKRLISDQRNCSVFSQSIIGEWITMNNQQRRTEMGFLKLILSILIFAFLCQLKIQLRKSEAEKETNN